MTKCDSNEQYDHDPYILVAHEVGPAGNELRILGDPHCCQQTEQAQHPSLRPPTQHTRKLFIIKMFTGIACL